MNNELLILYDGMCNLCSGLIIFILKRQFIAKPAFITLQNKKYSELVEKHKIDKNEDTIIVIIDKIVYAKSTAIIMLFGQMKGIWNFGKYFIYIPKKIRDWMYILIANNRYRIFGKRKTCYYTNFN